VARCNTQRLVSANTRRGILPGIAHRAAPLARQAGNPSDRSIPTVSGGIVCGRTEAVRTEPADCCGWDAIHGPLPAAPQSRIGRGRGCKRAYRSDAKESSDSRWGISSLPLSVKPVKGENKWPL
jgi:hypothetical protein